MNPGRLEEQPMPLIVTTLWGETFISASTFCSEDRTPKSPQPGHQSGSTFPLKSAAVIGFGSSTVAIFAPFIGAGPPAPYTRISCTGTDNCVSCVFDANCSLTASTM